MIYRCVLLQALVSLYLHWEGWLWRWAAKETYDPAASCPTPLTPHFFHSHPLTRASKSLSFPLLSCTISCWDQSTLLTFNVMLLRCNYQNEQCCLTLSHLSDSAFSAVSRPQWWSTPVTTICELPCTGAFSPAHWTQGLKHAENMREKK